MNTHSKKTRHFYWTILFTGLALSVMTASLQAQPMDVVVTVENLAPGGGIYFTPVWLGFHNGSFDLFDPGGLASEALEGLAEDGDGAALRESFAAAVGGDAGGMDEVLTAPEGFAGAPVFDPGDRASVHLTVDSMANRYMSFVSMIIPSNDAFIGNHNPYGIELFDAAGHFKGKQIITVLGSMIWDAGTELNTEMDAAFFDQAEANTGMATMCPVLPHPGYLGSYANQGSMPKILGGMGPADIVFDPVSADFSLPYAAVARITIAPAPMGMGMGMGMGN